MSLLGIPLKKPSFAAGVTNAVLLIVQWYGASLVTKLYPIEKTTIHLFLAATTWGMLANMVGVTPAYGWKYAVIVFVPIILICSMNITFF